MPLPIKKDDILWSNIQTGDVSAFEELYLQYADMLYKYGLKFTPHIQLIEDSIQEVFIGIIKYHKSLSHTDNIKYYLLKTFKNRLLKILSKEKKFISSTEEDYHFDVQFSIEYEIIKSEEEEKRKNILTSVLKKLSSRQKEAIYLRYNKQLEYEEVASLLNMEIESCRNLVYRAISTLRKKNKNKNLILLLIVKNCR